MFSSWGYVPYRHTGGPRKSYEARYLGSVCRVGEFAHHGFDDSDVPVKQTCKAATDEEISHSDSMGRGPIAYLTTRPVKVLHKPKLVIDIMRPAIPWAKFPVRDNSGT
jgi:hypothetical protein